MTSKTFILFGLLFASLFILSTTAVDTSQDDKKDIADNKDHYGGGWGGGGWGGWGGYGGGGGGGSRGGGWGGGGWGGWGGGGGGWGGRGPCKWGCCGYHSWAGCQCCYSPQEAIAYMKHNEATARP